MKIKSIGNDGKGSLLQDKNGCLKATVTVNGTQLQKRVKSEEEAVRWVLSMQLERDNRDELSAKQLNDASNALHILKKAKVDVTFVDLARYYIDNAFEGVVTVGQAIEEYIEKCKIRVTEGTLRNYKRFLSDFNKKYSEKKIAAIKPKDMMDHLMMYEDSTSNWLNAQRALSKLFVECEKYGYCSKNPCHLLEPPRNVKSPGREYLSADDTRKLLQCAEKRKNKGLVIYLALGLFGGLRPSEAFRMDAKHINLKTGYIRISADITKTHSFKERTFQIESTLMAWLRRYYDGESKPVSYKNGEALGYAVYTAFKNADVKKTPDVLRHSYGTYRFALTGNSAETASIMGHSESIGNHYYRGRATKDEAMKYFAIRPKDNVETDLDSL